MKDSYQALFEAIKAKCRQRHWFGIDDLDPGQYNGILEEYPYIDSESIEAVSPDDPNRFGFVYPPATEEQLGFTFPPLLRALYAHVANGGFGPMGGLHGAYGGYQGSYPGDDNSLPAQRHEGLTFDYDTYKKYKAEAVARGEWPHMRVRRGTSLQHLLELCDLGCCITACIDDQERVFLKSPTEDNDYYVLRQLPYTFEEWLWRCIRDENLCE